MKIKIINKLIKNSKIKIVKQIMKNYIKYKLIDMK